jgi:cell division septation protein DedD
VPRARYYAIVAPPSPAARRFAESRGWWTDRDASALAPDAAHVICVDQDVGSADQLAFKTAQLQDELRSEGLDPAGMAAHLIGVNDPLATVGSSSEFLTFNLVGSDEVTETFGKLLPQIDVGQAQPSASPTTSSEPAPAEKPAQAGKPVEEAKKPESGEEEKKDEEATEAPKPSDCCEATTISASLSAFADPDKVWRWAGAGERGEVARELLPKLYEARSAAAARAGWLVAPEMVLLDGCAEEKRPALAEELLRTRGKLTEEDTEMRKARSSLAAGKVDMAKQDVALAVQRVKLAEEGVKLAGELYEHMRKWRAIANWGIGILCATTIFSMLGVAYVLLKLMPDDKVSDVAAPIIVFVLALFAISPAVLLLRERPLGGLDQWSPGGAGADGDAGDKENDPASETGKDPEPS